MIFNDYKNWETFLFAQYFGFDIYELLKDQFPVDYSTICETIENIIDEMRKSTDKVEFKHQFIKDLVSLSFDEIDIEQVADTVLEIIKEYE